MMIAPNAHRWGRRRGIASLLEALVAISLTAILFGSTATLTIALYRLERLGREELAATITEARLARDFRDDARAALGVDPESRPEFLALELPNGSASYRFDGDEVLRQRNQPGRPDRTERYRLPGETVARWEIGASGGLITIFLDRSARQVRIDSKLGSDHRYRKGLE